MKKVFVFLADGFEEIEAITPIDLLRRAEIPVVTVSITEKKEVVGAHNITVVADQIFDKTDFSQSDFLILPGGLNGMLKLKAHSGLGKLLKKQNAEQKGLASICASPSILGELGLLENREAICYPSFEPNLKGATISSASVVTDQNITTAKGVGVAIDFALEIIAILKGEKVAGKIANDIIYKR